MLSLVTVFGWAILVAPTRLEGQAKAPPLPQALSPLDLVPEQVEGLFQIRGLDGFRQRLHTFLRECMPAAAEMTRQTLDEQVRAFLENRERKELDGERAVFFAVMRWRDLRQAPPSIIVGLPVRDGDAFLRSFLLAEERKELRPHPLGCHRTVIAEQEVFIVPRGGYVLLTPVEALAKLLVVSPEQKPLPPLAQRLTEQEIQRWIQADLAFYVKLSAVVEQIRNDLEFLRGSSEASPGEYSEQAAVALVTTVVDLFTFGEEVEHCVITGQLEKEGARVHVSLRPKPHSTLEQTLAASRLDKATDLNCMPDGMIYYGYLPTALSLEPFLRRYHRTILQAGNRAAKKFPEAERQLADAIKQVLDSRLQRFIWALDTRSRGMLILEAERPEQARQGLFRWLDTLARHTSVPEVRLEAQAEAGKLLDLPASRIELEIKWGALIGAHGPAGQAEEAILRYLVGHQWTLWLVADDRRLFLISTRDVQEAERWLRDYREGRVCAENAILQRHRQPLGETLSGLAMLQFSGLWRYILESIEKAANAQGLGNLIPKEVYPEAKSAFFSLGLRVRREGLELEFWAPKETLREFDRLFQVAVHGLF
ncbi:MAG: hypothetical protein RMI91_09480 [Gemmatales bacterium]|nr:hypothetical protein [Gemmatales bacterium]MDW7994872.1 hypothetical protein [Gemmatales bacterium]